MKIIYLVGPRACGKSTIGKMLARGLGLSFIDMDESVMQKAGQSIAEIVATYGWPHFRKLESEALRHVSQVDAVIATGGGIVIDRRNREFMKQNGIVVYLKARPGILAQRLCLNPDNIRRPSLTGKAAHDEIAEVLAEREPLYQDAANLIQWAETTPEQVVGELLKALQVRG